MSKAIAPTKKVTCTIAKQPSSEGARKTLERLMRLQHPVQKGLRRLQKLRKQERNKVTRRGGRNWIVRAKATKIVQVKEGQSFTLTITPQIIPDLQSVEKFLTIKSAS